MQKYKAADQNQKLKHIKEEKERLKELIIEQKNKIVENENHYLY